MPKRLRSGSWRQPRVSIRRHGGVYAARAIYRVATLLPRFEECTAERNRSRISRALGFLSAERVTYLPVVALQ